MKNCLVICDQFNIGPTGLVIANLVKGLFDNGCKTSIVAFNVNPNQYHTDYLLLKQDKYKYSSKIYKLCMIFFKSYMDRRFLRRDRSAITKKIIMSKQSTPIDFIILTCSGNVNIRFLRLASNLANIYKIPLVIHSTDPIPSPVTWGEKPIYRKAVLAAIKPFYNNANIISASNPVMLGYQTKALGIENKDNIVMYNPIDSWNPLDHHKIIKNTFLYVGSLYGKRNPKVLIDCFLELLNIVPNARLTFLGTDIKLEDYAIPKGYKKNFSVIAYTDSIDEYITESEILIDYNANIKEDVFISSKLSKYLSYNRKIILLCAENSAPDLFITQPTEMGVWKCLFDKDDFFQIAKDALRIEQNDWTSRIKFVSYFNAKNETLKIFQKLNNNKNSDCI